MAYTNSPLVSYTKLSPNHSGQRTHSIDRITPHCVVGQCSVETLGEIFYPTSRQASCNYGIGVDGRVGMYVEEKNRSWCSSSNANDQRAVTIECASDTKEPYAFKDIVYNRLIELCVDICRRNGKKKLLWLGDKDKTLNYSPAGDEMVLSVHRWFANKSCPGNWMYARMGDLAGKVTAALGGSTETAAQPVTTTDTEKSIWDFLYGKLGNAYGAAGLMGNLYAESALKPTNLQNTYEKSLGMTDAQYTAAVDGGSYTNFVKDSAGYGLAQWTYWSRKQALLEFAKAAGKSIGDLQMQLDFLWKEIQGYTSVLNTLKTATTVKAASDAVLTGYEKPADQGDAVKTKRTGYGQTYFDKYAKAETPAAKLTDGYYRVRLSWEDSKSQKGAYRILGNAKATADANPGYSVYDPNGKAVYTSAAPAAKTAVPFFVKVKINDLNIRTGPGTNYGRTGVFTGIGIFTIVKVSQGAGADKGWGKLKSGAGWISLDYCEVIN